MHPILSRPGWLAAYVAAWLPLGVLLAVALGRDAHWTTAVALLVPLVVAQAFLVLSAWHVCLVFPLVAWTAAWRAVVAHLAASVTTSALWVAVGQVWAATLDPLFAGGEALRLHTDQRATLALVGSLLFLLAAGLHYVVIAVQASQATERRAMDLELLARRAELAALRAQINPHFLFNSLHSIATLTTTDPDGARRMSIRLADFLRDTLRTGRRSRITLDEEVTLAEQYLAIERVRFGSRLQVDVEAGVEARVCQVPPLLLQPVVENAVVHGIGQMVDGGTVTLTARRDGAVLVVTSANPYDPANPGRRGEGLGLVLLRKRLGTEFGAGASVRTEALETQFRVELRLPAVVEPDLPSPATSGRAARARKDGTRDNTGSR